MFMEERESLQLRVVGDSAPELAADSADWEATYRREVDRVYGFIFVRVGNRADAEDICAQVFLRARPRLRAGADSRSVHGYLLATARTIVADHWTAHYQARTLQIDVEDDGLLPAGLAAEDTSDHAVRVQELLDRLPDRERRVLELRFLRGYSIKETAAALNVTVANCKVIQFRALRRAATMEESR